MATTGVIGDIHLDMAALDAALEGPVRDCDAYVVTGDFLDRGPDDPLQVLERLRALPNVTLLVGNHELAYLGGPAYPGMLEDRSLPLAATLRRMVIDGELRAAAAVDGTLCVHAGVTRAWWHARGRGEARQVAAGLNHSLLRAVTRRSFRSPAFAALGTSMPGPFWADPARIIAAAAPPFDQVVGHVPLPHGWHDSPGDGGRVRSLCRAHEAVDEAVGSVALTGLPAHAPGRAQ